MKRTIPRIGKEPPFIHVIPQQFFSEIAEIIASVIVDRHNDALQDGVVFQVALDFGQGECGSQPKWEPRWPDPSTGKTRVRKRRWLAKVKQRR